MDYKLTEGEYLKRAIRARGLTLEEAGLKLGLKRTALHYYLGKKELPEEFKQKIRENIGISFPSTTINLPPIEGERIIVITESELRQLITECVKDALKQFSR
jgi:hypothetical protein